MAILMRFATHASFAREIIHTALELIGGYTMFIGHQTDSLFQHKRRGSGP